MMKIKVSAMSILSITKSKLLFGSVRGLSRISVIDEMIIKISIIISNLFD